ncbi:MAG: hypothetical protein K5920_09510 [Bacteroidales bacterium]|nr:hypothetical protein [Bacteroidales bacterium]
MENFDENWYDEMYQHDYPEFDPRHGGCLAGIILLIGVVSLLLWEVLK